VATYDLSGKTAVVTGASSGIGQATARQLAAAGVRVAGGARRVDRLKTDVALEVDVTNPVSADTVREAVSSSEASTSSSTTPASRSAGMCSTSRPRRTRAPSSTRT
jgi:NADP-dependent 3-hydroxy acid dehydrogenase YdfG